jgi:hypothetical protein
MSNRRDFLKTSAAVSAAVAALDSPAALAADAAPPLPIELRGEQPLRFALYGTPLQTEAPLRTRLDSLARGLGTTVRRLDIQALNHVPMPWMADDIALLTRYTPAPDGVLLDFAALAPSAAPVRGFEHFWAGRRNAVAVGIEPYAMLINKAKARAAGVPDYTLAGFAARGLRPRLAVNLDLSTGDNSWIHPLFAEYTGWHQRAAPDVAGLFLDAAALQGMDRLRDVLVNQCDASTVASADAVHSALLDSSQPEAVAAYGNPLLLAARLAGMGRSDNEFEEVSLQQFMGLRAPSLFRVAALQLGSGVQQAQAAEVAALLFDPLARQQLASLLPHVARPQSPRLAALPHDFGFYAGLPHLNVIADARVMTALVLALKQPVEELEGTEGQKRSDVAGDISGRVYLAAAAAYYDLARYAQRDQELLSVAQAAAPDFRLA